MTSAFTGNPQRCKADFILHVTADLARLGLVAWPNEDEFADLVEGLNLGAANGLWELGFRRDRGGTTSTGATLPKCSTADAFRTFSVLFRDALRHDVQQVRCKHSVERARCRQVEQADADQSGSRRRLELARGKRGPVQVLEE